MIRALNKPGELVAGNEGGVPPYRAAIYRHCGTYTGHTALNTTPMIDQPSPLWNGDREEVL